MRGFPAPADMPDEAVSYAALDGFGEDDHFDAFRVFAASCRAIIEHTAVLRPATPPPADLEAVCRRAVLHPPRDGKEARIFFESYFEPRRLESKSGSGFVTGYYEPVVDGALTPDAEFSAPILARPYDLITLAQGESLAGPDGPLQAARSGPDGLEPYPDRAAIESGALADHARPLVWLRDKVEVFFIQVQGSARVRLRDGTEARLTYAGRNGHPYTSIGRVLIEEEHVPPEKAGLTGLKQWLRAKGQSAGEPGGALMQRNKSYIFFTLTELSHPEQGPIGGQGIPLTVLRSIALDRSLWPYGLPIWVDAEIPWRSETPEPFRRLMIGQDTGSAIVGPSRGDLFFGSGEVAGLRAGALRHAAAFTVLWPRALAVLP